MTAEYVFTSPGPGAPAVAPRPKQVLQLVDVSVSFDGLAVLDGLDFSMDAGEMRFLIGPNGAGKTTMLDVITARTRPARGFVVYDEIVDVRQRAEHELVRLGLARKFQTPAVFRSLTVYENLVVALGFRDTWPRLMRRLSPEQSEHVLETLLRVGLAGKRSQLASTLSHGELQWLEVGTLLVQKPKLLLLDEPVAGMTRPERDQTGALLRSIAGACSILVVEHDMAFVREFADTVTVLHLGKILSEGPVQQVQNDPRVVEVYLGHRHERTR
jgi:urea transport system ATP-binding protein